jgi:ketosteroid isomerase-like protein
MVRMRLTLLALIPLLATGVSAQSAPDWSSDSAAVAAASRAWMRALQDGDRPALESIMAPEFMLDTPGKDGPALPRDQWLTNAFTLIETDSADYPLLRVRQLGPDLAISNGQLLWKARFKGVPVPAVHNFTDVWVRRDGRWQVIARDADLSDGSFATITFVVGALLGGVVWALIVGVRWGIRRRTGQRPPPG